MNQAKVLMMMFVCVMYAGGMPLFYPLCLIILIINYWYNKYMLFKYCQKNQTFNENLIINSYSVLKFAFLAHFFMTIEMYKRSKNLHKKMMSKGHFDNVAFEFNALPKDSEEKSEYLDIYYDYMIVVIVLYCINLFVFNPLTFSFLNGCCY
jgi:hypothetical protein